MPVIKIAGKLVYFAHVPKCAGTSVEHYLRDRFEAVGLLDWAYLDQPEDTRWSRTSPQHIDVDSLDRLMPLSLFDEVFALVRHPVTRLKSVFCFQRDAADQIPKGMAFSTWLSGLATAPPFYLDNHVLPMARLVPKGSQVFRLEEGMHPVIDWLDALAGNADGPREMPATNRLGELLDVLGRSPGPAVDVSAADMDVIRTLYAEDFQRFGYGADAV